MSLLLDFLPIVLFFVTFQVAQGHPAAVAPLAHRVLDGLPGGPGLDPQQYPILLATVVVMVASIVQVAWMKLAGRRIPLMLWISLGLVIVMGGATLWLHDANFIKWKPTLLYWAMAAVFGLAPRLAGRNLVQATMGEQIAAPSQVWRQLNLAWVAFFAFMGALNLFVAFHFPTPTWVSFKLFGGMGLLVTFALGQAAWLGRHAQEEPADERR